MYTTLTMLKNNKACIPGFGRLATFFGVGPTVRDQKIPLHVVSLVGGKSDLEWALANACIIDALQFEDLYRRTLPQVWSHQINATLIRTGTQNPFSNFDGRKDDLQAVVKAAFKAITTPEILEFRKKYRGHSWDKQNLQNLLSVDWWDSPHKYMIKLCSIIDSNYKPLDSNSKSPNISVPVFPPISKVHTVGQRMAHLLCPTDTYEFTHTMTTKSQSRITRTETGLVLNLSSSEDAFHVMRMVANGTLPDQDALDDTDDGRESTYQELRNSMEVPSTPAPRPRRAARPSPVVNNLDEEEENDEDEEEF